MGASASIVIRRQVQIRFDDEGREVFEGGGKEEEGTNLC